MVLTHLGNIWWVLTEPCSREKVTKGKKYRYYCGVWDNRKQYDTVEQERSNRKQETGNRKRKTENGKRNIRNPWSKVKGKWQKKERKNQLPYKASIPMPLEKWGKCKDCSQLPVWTNRNLSVAKLWCVRNGPWKVSTTKAKTVDLT